jgi:hypothetical protein
MCFHYSNKGYCKFGERCQFTHIRRDEIDSDDDEENEIDSDDDNDNDNYIGNDNV